MEPITDENIKDLVLKYLDGNSGLPEINSWDVSNVTNMNELFFSEVEFNEPLDMWNVSNVTDMSNMFTYALKFNQPLNGWNVSNVKYMNGMFSNANSFNQPLNGWNVSNVTSMSGMFMDAITFNQPLNGWNVSNVKYMNSMFEGARNFDIRNLPEIFFTSNEFRRQNRYLFINGVTLSTLASQLYNKIASIPLTNSIETINLQNSGYNAITMEEIQFSEYLKQDIANILIQYNGKMYFANKTSIKALVLDGSAIKYGCKTVSTSMVPKRDNLYDEPCFNMNSIGIISGLVYLSKIKTILETSELKVFEIPTEPIANYVSTASLQMLSSQPNAVGASHCQEGQNANVFDIKIISYESTGGKKTKKSLKKTRKSMKKSKKIRKNLKTRKNHK